MNYEQFEKCMERQIRNKFSLPIKEVVFKKTVKVNIVQRQMAFIFEDLENISLAVSTLPLFELYQEGYSVEDLAELLAADIEPAVKKISSFPTMNIISKASKENIFISIINAEKNADLLKNVPHIKIADLAIVARYNLNLFENNRKTGSFLINDEHCEKLFHLSVKKFIEYMKCLLDTNDYTYNNQFPLFTVVSNKDCFHGATAMASKKYMDEILEKLGMDFFILPSSQHEILVIPDNGSYNKNELEKMIIEVNQSEVEEEDWLSDHVYYYDGALHVL